VWRKRRRFAFWRNRPTWRRRRALAIGRAHSLCSHPGWLETAQQTAHMCFSVINPTMTPSRRRAQDCTRPLVLPYGCVCPPAFHERAPGAGCGSAQTERGHDRLPSACPCCACRLMHGSESGSVHWPAALPKTWGASGYPFGPQLLLFAAFEDGGSDAFRQKTQPCASLHPAPEEAG
jgi:hypothetical protein